MSTNEENGIPRKEVSNLRNDILITCYICVAQAILEIRILNRSTPNCCYRSEFKVCPVLYKGHYTIRTPFSS
jgi:hypothetical protein